MTFGQFQQLGLHLPSFHHDRAVDLFPDATSPMPPWLLQALLRPRLLLLAPPLRPQMRPVLLLPPLQLAFGTLPNTCLLTACRLAESRNNSSHLVAPEESTSALPEQRSTHGPSDSGMRPVSPPSGFRSDLAGQLC